MAAEEHGEVPQLPESPQPAPRLSIHDPVHWEHVNEYVAERFAALKTTAMQERTAEEQADWDVYLYDMMRTTFYFIEVLAREQQPAPEAPKPARKRATRVPKTALPDLNDTDVE